MVFGPFDASDESLGRLVLLGKCDCGGKVAHTGLWLGMGLLRNI